MGPVAREAGRTAASAAAAAETQTSGTVVVLSPPDRLSPLAQKETGASLWGAGGRIPRLSCFRKAAAGAGSDTLRLVSDALQ